MTFYFHHPAGMRFLWEISIRSSFRGTSHRPLRNISKEMTFLWRLWDVETSQKHLPQVFGTFQTYLTKKMVLCDFRMVITISNKIDVGPLKTLKKWNVFWEQCRNINHVCHEYQWADVSVRVLVGQLSSKPNIRYTIYYF